MSQSDDCDKAKRARYTDLLPDVVEPDLPEAQGFRKDAQNSVRGQRGHITVMILFILF